MEIDQILGGVSPLKARSGKKARKATSTSSRRGGYSKSTSSKNRGGYNRQTRFQADKWTPPTSSTKIGPVASPSAPAATAPYSGGTTNYTFGDDNSTTTTNTNTETNTNEANVNTGPEYTDVWVEGTEATTKTETTPPGSRPSYIEAWNNMDDDDGGGKKNKYGKVFLTFEDFEKEAKKWNKENPGYKTEGSTKTTTIPGTPGYYERRLVEGAKVTINQSNKSGGLKNSGLPFTMRANPFYRNYGIGGEPKKK